MLKIKLACSQNAITPLETFCHQPQCIDITLFIFFLFLQVAQDASGFPALPLSPVVCKVRESILKGRSSAEKWRYIIKKNQNPPISQEHVVLFASTLHLLLENTWSQKVSNHCRRSTISNF